MGVELFRLVMTKKRFQFLLRHIRFDNKATRMQRKEIDKLAAIRTLFDAFIKRCKECYSVGQNVTIDEMLPSFRGRCSFRQYIPSKPSRYGIKMFASVDSRIHYLHNLEVYVGKQPDGPFSLSNSPFDVVMRLSEPLHGTGRNIVADNWFSSVPLVQELKKKKLSFVGTMKKNKKELPTHFIAGKNRKVCSSVFGFNEDGTLVSYVPKKQMRYFDIKHAL